MEKNMKRGTSRYLTPAMIVFDMNIYLKIQFDTEIVIYYMYYQTSTSAMLSLINHVFKKKYKIIIFSITQLVQRKSTKKQ